MTRRLLRAVTRPLKRLVRPLRLRWIDYKMKCSRDELERLYNMRDDFIQLEAAEKKSQEKLEAERKKIEGEM